MRRTCWFIFNGGVWPPEQFRVTTCAGSGEASVEKRQNILSWAVVGACHADVVCQVSERSAHVAAGARFLGVGSEQRGWSHAVGACISDVKGVLLRIAC